MMSTQTVAGATFKSNWITVCSLLSILKVVGTAVTFAMFETAGTNTAAKAAGHAADTKKSAKVMAAEDFFTERELMVDML